MELENLGSVTETEPQETAAPADNTTTEPEEEVKGETTAEPAEQQTSESADVQVPDAVWAAARKRAEAEADRRMQAELAKRDAAFSNVYAGQMNPATGKPIASMQEYVEAVTAARALRAQKAQEQAAAALKQSGLDPSILNQAIENNPAVMQAAQIIEENKRLAEEAKQRDMETQLESQFQAIQSLDPAITKPEDLDAIPEVKAFQDYVKAGVPIDVAYKSACFDRLASAKAAAAKQTAINQTRSKGHLVTTGASASVDGGVDIPENVLSMWQEAYPDLSPAKLREKYNNNL